MAGHSNEHFVSRYPEEKSETVLRIGGSGETYLSTIQQPDDIIIVSTNEDSRSVVRPGYDVVPALKYLELIK